MVLLLELGGTDVDDVDVVEDGGGHGGALVDGATVVVVDELGARVDVVVGLVEVVELDVVVVVVVVDVGVVVVVLVGGAVVVVVVVVGTVAGGRGGAATRAAEVNWGR